MERDRKKRQANSVLVDYNKLSEELKKRDVSKTAASKQMGYSDNYLTNIFWDAKRRGCLDGQAVLPQTCVNLLFEMFNIRLESIEWKDLEPVTPTDAVPSALSFDENTLYRVIYAAVYAAMKQALSE